MTTAKEVKEERKRKGVAKGGGKEAVKCRKLLKLRKE